MDDIQIDEVDRSILHQLQLNARQTDTEIAEKVDVTPRRFGIASTNSKVGA